MNLMLDKADNETIKVCYALVKAGFMVEIDADDDGLLYLKIAGPVAKTNSITYNVLKPQLDDY